jgi:hypothetical protein
MLHTCRIRRNFSLPDFAERTLSQHQGTPSGVSMEHGNLVRHHAKASRPPMTFSNLASHFRGISTFQHFNIGITSRHTDFMHTQVTPWKQNRFLSFHNDQHSADDSMLTTPNLVLQSQHLATDSKLVPIWKPTTSDTTCQACFATTHSKNKWWTDSCSSQNKQVLLSNFLLLSKLSLVSDPSQVDYNI